jgi:hypothetical protein
MSPHREIGKVDVLTVPKRSSWRDDLGQQPG